ncbi:hypothetical protein AAC387_Pa10g0887 [Persea americana]
MIHSSGQCFRSSEPKQKLLRLTHLLARTSDVLKRGDSSVSARVNFLVARANLLQSLMEIRNLLLIVPKLPVLVLINLGNLKHVLKAI